jgi:non-ribosomal peptide synthase protein (TIGR01720 family)
VPSVFAELAGVPLTAGGKLDRAGLPDPGGSRVDLGAGYVAPVSAVEGVLAGIWARVLGVERVGIADNFFELGGDSILSIQVVSQARLAGVYVSAAQMFRYQTVAGLAGVAAAQAVVDAEQGAVSGELVLSPVQAWFFGRGLPEPAHFNQSMLLEVAGRVAPGVLRVAVAALAAHHDMLRARFVAGGAGWPGWSGWVPAGGPDPGELVEVVQAAGRDRVWLAGRASAAQASLSLERGVLARFVLFERGSAGQLLLVVIHHLAVDAVSWPVVVQDLADACGQAERGLAVRLPAKTTSFRRWSQRLAELAGEPAAVAEEGYWRRAGEAGGVLPADHDGPNTVASAREVSTVLGAAVTARLLREVPGAYRTQINDVLLTALGMALTGWARSAVVVVDLEGHGREDAGPGIDVSRTVGWFTTIYPVVLGGAGDGDLGAALVRTKEYLRAVPRRGLGYGLGYYRDRGPGPSRAQVSFNYLGQPGGYLTQPPAPAAARAGAGAGAGGGGGGVAGRLRPAGSLGQAWSLAGERAYLLEINSQVTPDGRLVVTWTYSTQVHDQATVSALAGSYARALASLIEHCTSPGAGRYTPSDFPLAGLDQDALNLIQQRFGSPAPARDADSGGRS